MGGSGVESKFCVQLRAKLNKMDNPWEEPKTEFKQAATNWAELYQAQISLS